MEKFAIRYERRDDKVVGSGINRNSGIGGNGCDSGFDGRGGAWIRYGSGIWYVSKLEKRG